MFTYASLVVYVQMIFGAALSSPLMGSMLGIRRRSIKLSNEVNFYMPMRSLKSKRRRFFMLVVCDVTYSMALFGPISHRSLAFADTGDQTCSSPEIFKLLGCPNDYLVWVRPNQAWVGCIIVPFCCQ